MRTKNEIITTSVRNSSTVTDRELMLEVLLDIREILQTIVISPAIKN